MKKWYIRLDTQKQKDNELITMVKQDIYSNELYINLVNNGKPIDLKDAVTVGIAIDKADATEVIGSCRVVDIDRGLIAYVVDYQAIAAIGLNTFTVKIVYADSALTTTSFIVNVIDDPFAGTNGSIVSSSEYPILTAMMQENTEIKNAELIRVTSEIDRIENENNRVATELVRVSNESTRGVNENTRGSNETARINAESTRGSNESERIAAEDIRKSNESSRVNVESIRASNESSRVTVEANRVIAEGIRADNETERISNENIRISNESSRGSSENLRVTQEDARKAAEVIRGSNEDNRIAAEGLRDDAYNQAEDARDIAYTQAEIDRDGLYNTEESERNSNYLTVEGNRGTSYTQAEGARDNLYATAELGRDSDYDDAEIARDNLYDTAEDNRDSLYTAAEAARDAKIGEMDNLTTTEKGTFVGALNEVNADLTQHKLEYVELEREVTELSYITQRYTIESWQKVQELVRAGLADKAFKVGDQFVANYNNVPTVFDVIGINHDIPTDKNFINSLTIQAHDCILNVMFDSPEALYMVKDAELPAGVYHFTYNAIKYQFTLSQPVPIGGQLTFPWAYNTDILTTKISTFESQTSTVVIETVTIVIGSEGTELLNINDINRCRYGSNNYKESAVRQWLNNSAAAFVWAPQTDYDRPPTGAPHTGSGFLNLLDPELVAVIGEVDKQVARNTVTDGGGQDLFSDKVFLLSRVETGYGTEGVTTGEVVYPYYEGLSEAGKIKLLSNTPRHWWLRSPHVGGSHLTRGVYTSGALSSYNASNAYGLSPACVII